VGAEGTERNGTGVCYTEISFLMFWNRHVNFLLVIRSEGVKLCSCAEQDF